MPRKKQQQPPDEPVTIPLQGTTIVGVDASVEKTGVAVGTDDANWYTRFLQTPKESVDPGRIVWIAEAVAAVVSEACPERVLLMIESPIQQRGTPINRVLHLRIREELARRFDTYVLPLHPNQVKKFACNDLGNEKGTIAFQAARKWGDDLPDNAREDEIEALVMAKMGECWLTQDDDAWLKYEVEAAAYAKKGVLRELQHDTATFIQDDE